ncbi:MAG: hypothetical protein WDO71_10970 [Bacteroidota bacterium]
MKAIKFLTASVIMAVLLLTSVTVSAQKDPDRIDWEKVKSTNSITLDSLMSQVRQLYNKVFFMEAVAKQIEAQLNGTAQTGDIEKLIDQIEQFTKELENLGVIGGKLLDMASDEEFLKKVKNEVPVIKYLRALKNTATALKAAKIITEKAKNMITIVIPSIKARATAFKKVKAANRSIGKL